MSSYFHICFQFVWWFLREVDGSAIGVSLWVRSVHIFSHMFLFSCWEKWRKMKNECLCFMLLLLSNIKNNWVRQASESVLSLRCWLMLTVVLYMVLFGCWEIWETDRKFFNIMLYVVLVFRNPKILPQVSFWIDLLSQILTWALTFLSICLCLLAERAVEKKNNVLVCYVLCYLVFKKKIGIFDSSKHLNGFSLV